MPRRRSMSIESVRVVPASTLPSSGMAPASYSSRSVRLVLPASTCARIPRLRVLTERHVLRVGGPVRAGHECSCHDGVLSPRRCSAAHQPAGPPATQLQAGVPDVLDVLDVLPDTGRMN